MVSALRHLTGPGRIEAGILFLVLSAASFAPRAYAYDPIRVPSTPIRRLNIEGNRAISDGEIIERMKRIRGGWFRNGKYRAKWLEKDLEEVIRYYGNLGFLDARIEEEEVTWDRERESVSIRILIDEGTRIVVDSILFNGMPGLDLEKLRKRLALREGKPFNREMVNIDRIRVHAFLAESGYAGAKVDLGEQMERERVTLVYDVLPGPRMKIGPIRVAGTIETKEHFVRRELTFREGDWFNRLDLLKSRDRVYKTGLFYNVAMIREEAEGGRVVPIRVDVREKKVRWFEFGTGFGTEDLLRLSVDWNNRNWFRSGRRLSLEVVFSELLSDRPYEQRYEILFIEPWMFRTRTAGLLKLSQEKLNLENFVIEEEGEEERVINWYRLDRTTASFILSRELSEIFKGWITFSHEWADAGDPSEPVDEDLLQPDATRAVAFTLERDARDNLLDPSMGTRFLTSLEFAGGVFGGDNEYRKSLAWGAAYQRILGPVVLAERVQFGYLDPTGGDDRVPDHKLFRLGGANTVRGYREESIGPGKVQVLANLELRFTLFWRLGGVLFLDGGNTWERFGDITLSDFTLKKNREETDTNDFRYGLGTGIRIYTPVGPLRVDYARKTKRLVDHEGNRESESVIHFSIGQAF